MTIAETYPSRPVKIVVPFPAGRAARLHGSSARGKIGGGYEAAVRGGKPAGGSWQSRNRSGRKAPADGYTLLFVLDTPLTVNPSLYAKLAFDPGRDFAPISTVASFSLTLVVHPSVPVSSVSEFVAYAKTRKDRPLLYGSGGGRGDPGHLTMEYFRMRPGSKPPCAL